MNLRSGLLGGLLLLSVCCGNRLYAQSYDAAPDFYVINEDAEDIILDVSGNDINTTGVLDIYLTIATPPANGTVILDAVNDLFIYTPNPDFFGTEIFDYTGCANTDPADICGTTSVIITVHPLDDTPVAVDDAAVTFINTPITVEPLLNDIDNDDQGLTIEILDDADFGATTIVGGEVVFYEPFADVFGEDCFTYRACKIGSDVYCDTAAVCVNVQSTNFNAPLAVNDTVLMTLGDTINIAALANDFDGDGDFLSITELLLDETTGTATVIVPDLIQYSATELGPDDIGYVVCDNNIPSYCDTACVRVKVLEQPLSEGNVHVPNSFSPNGDGIFDAVTVDWPGNNIRFIVRIYDRWNNLVFEKMATQSETEIWDGRTNVEFISSSGEAPEGTYFYVLRVDGLLDPVVGFIVLKR